MVLRLCVAMSVALPGFGIDDFFGPGFPKHHTLEVPAGFGQRFGQFQAPTTNCFVHARQFQDGLAFGRIDDGEQSRPSCCTIPPRPAI